VRQTRVPCHVLKVVLLASMLKPDEATITAVAAVGMSSGCLSHVPVQSSRHSRIDQAKCIPIPNLHTHTRLLFTLPNPQVFAPPPNQPCLPSTPVFFPLSDRPCVKLTKRTSLVGAMRILAGMSFAALDRPPKVPSRMMPGAHVSRPTRKLREPLICMSGLSCHVLAAALDAIWHIPTGDPSPETVGVQRQPAPLLLQGLATSVAEQSFPLSSNHNPRSIEERGARVPQSPQPSRIPPISPRSPSEISLYNGRIIIANTSCPCPSLLEFCDSPYCNPSAVLTRPLLAPKEPAFPNQKSHSANKQSCALPSFLDFLTRPNSLSFYKTSHQSRRLTE
jgi:hypothetical protein